MNAETCYLKMYEGMLNKDRELLEAALDDSFVLIHMTGTRQTKEDFIKAVEDGTLNYYSAEHYKVETSVHGSVADLCGQTLVVAGVYGGGQKAWRLQMDCKLVLRGEDWKITEAKASTY